MLRLLPLLACLAGFPAYAATWEEVARLGDGTVVSIDRESVTPSPPRPYSRDFPVVQVTARYGRAGGTTSAETRNSMDCTQHRQTALNITHYAADGTVTRRWSRVDYDFNYRPVTPGSVGDAIQSAVCGASRTAKRPGG